MTETRKLTTQEERWLAWYNIENKCRARCVLINGEGKWTHLNLVYDIDEKLVHLCNRHGVLKTLYLADEDVLWIAEYCNMELQFLVL